MSGQTDASDDLIAELAKLMAEDARTDTDVSPAPSQPVRIPGGEVKAAAPAPQQREPFAPIRIPGDDTTRPAPENAAPPADDFKFDFGIDFAKERTEAVAPAPVAAPTAQSVRTEPSFGLEVSAPPQKPDESADIHDTIADLISAELASDGESDEAGPSLSEAQPRPRTEDNFAVPPVFGLGSAAPDQRRSASPAPQDEPEQPIVEEPVSVPAAPVEEAVEVPVTVAQSESAEPDPLDEIEKLVGPSVRLDPPPPSPALRSLATPTTSSAPRPAPTRVEPGIATPRPSAAPQGSVEDAILAAAAATGAAVEWVEPERDLAAGEDELDEMPVRRRAGFGISRAFVGPLVAITLLLIAGLGLYWVLGNTGGTSGPAPLLTADASAIKEVPETTTDPDAAPQSVVFNEISGVDSGANEQIVSRDQADADAVSAVASVSDPSLEGLVNRKVRTVTVRPDGTIVSGEDGLAGGAMLPVDRPQVPDVPGADFSTPDMVASAESARTATPAATTSATGQDATATTATPPAQIVEPGSTVSVVDASGNVLPGRTAPVPLTRPADYERLVAALAQRQSLAPQTVATPATQPTITPPATTATPVQATAPQAVASTGGTAPAYVQLSSQRTEDAARQSAQNIVNRYGSLFGGASLEVQRVDLGERGIFYRVRVPANSLESANAICTNVKAAGGDCFTM